MSEEEFKKIAEKTMQEQIMKNLDSALIFTYIRNLESESDLKDKVINEICKYINEAKIMNKAIPVYPNKKDTPYTVGVASIEEIKQYFYKQVEKVEEENEK